MPLARSGLAVAAGFAVFSILFAVMGPGLGAVLTTIAAGLMAGYLTGKIAESRELLHGGATAGVVAAALVVQPALTLPARMVVAGLAVAAITAGAWVRGQARASREPVMAPRHDQSNQPPAHRQAGESGERPSLDGDGGEERS